MKNKTIIIAVNEELHKKTESFAHENGLTLSSVTRMALMKFLRGIDNNEQTNTTMDT